jgi:TatD DNase family protein
VAVDAHAHLDFNDFRTDLDAVIANARKGGISLIATAGTDIESSKQALEIAQKHPIVIASAGIHPHEAQKARSGYLDVLSDLCNHEKCVAIGEIGLDYHYSFSEKEVQQRVFHEQLDLARSLDMPVVIHSRAAEKEVFEAVKSANIEKAFFHCYTGNTDTARQILDAGYFIGVTGIVTFKDTANAEMIATLNPEQLITETDAPYLAPVPMRGKRNEPAYINYILKKLSEIFPDYTQADFSRLCLENAKALFT